CDVQRAAALTGELDVVSVHERIEPSMVGAGCENVAGVQRVNRGAPFNAARNLMRHVISVEILHDNTVVCQPDLQLVRIFDGQAGKRAASAKLTASDANQQHGNNSVLVGDSVNGNKNHHGHGASLQAELSPRVMGSISIVVLARSGHLKLLEELQFNAQSM